MYINPSRGLLSTLAKPPVSNNKALNYLLSFPFCSFEAFVSGKGLFCLVCQLKYLNRQ